MQVKIFQAFGSDQVDYLERQINDWLESDDTIKVSHTNTAAASASAVGGIGGDREIFQTLVVSIWYENSN